MRDCLQLHLAVPNTLLRALLPPPSNLGCNSLLAAHISSVDITAAACIAAGQLFPHTYRGCRRRPRLAGLPTHLIPGLLKFTLYHFLDQFFSYGFNKNNYLTSPKLLSISKRSVNENLLFFHLHTRYSQQTV